MSRARDVSNDQANVGGSVAPFTAGKNKIINGDFGVWQRGAGPFSTYGYTSDRWQFSWSGVTTATITRQTFTPGTAPVVGYEGTYFARYQRTAGSADDYFLQRVEDVRTFANQTFTISFWAKANANTTISQVYAAQNPGTGGSGGSGAGGFSGINITTSWARYSVTATMPSIAGMTIGTNSYVEMVFKFGSAMGNVTVDLWGVQFEAGSILTPFQTASGSIGGELALCQRYYYRWTSSATYSPALFGSFYTTTQSKLVLITPVTMRTAPSTLDYGGTFRLTDQTNYSDISSMSLVVSTELSLTPQIIATASAASFANYRPAWLTASNSTTAYMGVSAEL